MPIRRYLDSHNFDGETIRQMGIAFEMALASLRPTPDWNDPIRAALAQRIIALAKAGERDTERLCEGALSVELRTAYTHPTRCLGHGYLVGFRSGTSAYAQFLAAL
jgi:hypothetical protein